MGYSKLSIQSTERKEVIKMILHVILILIILKLSGCSLVLDAMSQNTLYVSSYCPAMKNCIEGSHVICQYYNHRRPVGKLCHNYVKVSITPQMVQQILEEVNKIRMKLATGEETGRDGQPLPRAYGMMRMHWDCELATLAQVLADQCLGLKEDDCRVTDKFPNPSQIITMINFNAPHWEYLNRNTTEPGLNREKISSSINKAFRSLQTMKRLISTNDINYCPVLERLPDKGSRSYLKLIRGKATHIGCGISAYTRAQILSSGTQHIYNSIQLVCNVSDGPLQAEPVYTTNPPVPDTGFTKKCGCPEGYSDSTGCLCEKATHGNIENTEIQWRDFNLNNDNRGHNQAHETEPCDDSNKRCEAANVVVLPIFQIQDAPETSDEPENDAEKRFDRGFGNTSFIPPSMEENEIPDSNVNPEMESDFRRHTYRQGASGEERKKTYDNVPISNEETAELFQHISRASMEDNIADPRQNSGYDDRMEEEHSFLEILENLETAMKNIKLEGAERDMFDFKMRKIYEAALKSKSISRSNELEDEFQKLTDYLRTKSDAAVIDESVHNDDTFDLASRRRNDEDEFDNDIDEKLLEILIHKHHHNDDYFSNHGSKLKHNIQNDAYTYPLSRKQEKINNNDKNLIKSNKLTRTFNIRNHKSLRLPVSTQIPQMPQFENDRKLTKKKINYERQRKLAVTMRKMGIFNNLDRDVKTYGRRAYSYPGRKARKSWNPPGFRKVFETEHERPTLPTTTQKIARVNPEIVSQKTKQYLKRDRAIL